MVSLEIKKGKEGAVNQSLNSVLLSLSCFVFKYSLFTCLEYVAEPGHWSR